jgi:hypothetical protein
MTHWIKGNVEEISKHGESITYEYTIGFDTETSSAAKLQFIQFFENKSDPF